MNTCKRLLLSITLLLFSTIAFAQSSTITIGSGIGLPGEQVVINVSFTAGSNPIAGVDMDLVFDDSLYSSVTVPGACGATAGGSFNACSVVGNTVNIANAGITAFTSGLLATVTFTIAGNATPGDDSLLEGTVNSLSDPQAVAPDPSTVPVTQGTLTVSSGPQPVFGSNPTPAAGVNLSGQMDGDIETLVVINNNGGATGSTLTYECAEGLDPDNKFIINGQASHSVAVGSTGSVGVVCDSTVLGTFTGTMECTHNGAASPATYALSCNVNEGPTPSYTGVAAGLAMNAPQEGDPDPSGTITITNTGDAQTTLTGTCTAVGAPQISVSNGVFNVVQGSGGQVVGVSCDASAEGEYASTISCPSNDANTQTATYAATCSVGPAGAAIFSSTPANGSTIEMTSTDVPVDAVVADQILTISNTASDPADNDLLVSGCALTGDTEISVSGDPAASIAPLGSSAVTFSCDTSEAGDFSATYACNYSVDGGEASAVASYTVNCGVREAESSITSNPAIGSTLSIFVPMNGSGSASITVSETLDEGVDATIDSCTLADGTDFVIETAFPVTIPAGGSALIEVIGTDPADGSLSAADVLSCEITDSAGTITADWTVELRVQTAVIPTLSTWGLLAMFLTMLGFGGMVIRRKSSI